MNTESDTATSTEPSTSSVPDSEWDQMDSALEGHLIDASPKMVDSASSLSDRLAQEIDDRKEERFYWIFAISLIADVALLPGVGAALTFFICSLQVIMLIGLANKLGVDMVVQLLQNLLNKLSPK